jgi:predicted Holliday junction resolvase-like endonuclease
VKQGKNSKNIIITSIICVTVVLVTLLGGLIYMQKQSIAQKNRELQQQKQLTEYEQQQINERQNRKEGSVHVDPCDKYSTC